jgi:putative PIN family toxin of toxin-antitoxin system
MSKQVVLDTNVLVAALKSSRGSSYRLLTLVDSGRFQLNVSTPLVAEYEEITRREVPGINVTDIIDYLCTVANRHKIFYLWRPILKDPDDDFVLELAVKCNAIIVTWNVKDFKKAAGFGITVMTPKTFLQQIGERP